MVHEIIPLPSLLISRASLLCLLSMVNSDLKDLYFLNNTVSSSGSSNSFVSKSLMSVINPSVVVETTLPPRVWMLWRHSPITLLMKAVLHEARIGFESSVPETLNILPDMESKDILLEIPLTTLP